MSQLLKNIFNYYKPKFESYVNNDLTLEAKDRRAMLEVLHYLDAACENRTQERADKVKLLNEFQKNQYKEINTIDVLGIAYFWAEKGFYRFKFDSKDVAIKYVLTKALLKTWNFKWVKYKNEDLNSYIRKESKIEFDHVKFIELLKETMVKDQRRLKL